MTTRPAMVWIRAPYFCAAVVPGHYGAPIIRYMVPWTLPAIERYCTSKGWSCVVIP